MIKYVEFAFHGVVFLDHKAEEVNTHDPNEIRIPDDAIGYRFYDVEEIYDESGYITAGIVHNSTPYTYIGTEYTAEEIEKCFPDQDILIRNVRNNHIKRVCRTRLGGFVPLKDDEKVIPG